MEEEALLEDDWIDALFDDPPEIDPRALGERWVYDWDHTDLLVVIQGRTLPVEAMMTARESDALSRMPEELTVYRGCCEDNVTGASWSLSRSIARGFWYGRVRLLVTGRVRKRDIIALKLWGGEQEVISLNVRVVGRERIGPKRPPYDVGD